MRQASKRGARSVADYRAAIDELLITAVGGDRYVLEELRRLARPDARARLRAKHLPVLYDRPARK